MSLLLASGPVLHGITWSAWVHFVDWGVSPQPTTLPFLLAVQIDYLPYKRRASLAFFSVFVVMALWLFLDCWAC